MSCSSSVASLRGTRPGDARRCARARVCRQVAGHPV